jgi:hypothetical protein
MSIPEQGVEEQFKELLSFVEADVNRWGQAAQRCEEVADKLSPPDRAQWLLFCAVFKEHAELHRNLVARVRQRVKNLNI